MHEAGQGCSPIMAPISLAERLLLVGLSEERSSSCSIDKTGACRKSVTKKEMHIYMPSAPENCSACYVLCGL